MRHTITTLDPPTGATGSPGGRRRYYVSPCDNGDSLGEPGVDTDAPPRAVTWLVCDRTRAMADGGHESIAEYDSRAEARRESSALNAAGGQV